MTESTSRTMKPVLTQPVPARPVPQLAGAKRVGSDVLRFELPRFEVGPSGLTVTKTDLSLADRAAVRRIEIVVTGNHRAQVGGLLDTQDFPNAEVRLIAPAGIEFAEPARLAVGGSCLVVTGQPKKNEFSFAEKQVGWIVNQGRLEVPAGKMLAFIGGRIEQKGTLRAPAGKIILAAPFKGSGFRVPGSGFETQIDGQHDDLLAGMSFERGGRGGDAGILEQFGTLDVTGDESGRIVIAAGLGFVGGEVSSDAFEKGGNIRISGQQMVLTGKMSATGLEGNGGSITVNTSIRTIQTSGSSLIANGGRFGKGGRVAVQGGSKLATDGVFLSGKLTTATTGRNGGEISVLGRKLDLVDAKLTAVGPVAGGRICLGDTRQLAAPGEIRAAQAVFVSQTSVINAGASGQGTGGDVRIWSESDTEVLGHLSAGGGPNGGEGGQIEVSGLGQVTMDGSAQPDAGKPGRLLLDPKNIVIDNTTGTFPQYSLVDANPAGTGFGFRVVPLSTGNLVVTKPSATVGAITTAGVVYLYNGLTGAVISTLTGSTTADQVGNNAPVALTGNGNYVIRTSPPVTIWEVRPPQRFPMEIMSFAV